MQLDGPPPLRILDTGHDQTVVDQRARTHIHVRHSVSNVQSVDQVIVVGVGGNYGAEDGVLDGDSLLHHHVQETLALKRLAHGPVRAHHALIGCVVGLRYLLKQGLGDIYLPRLAARADDGVVHRRADLESEVSGLLKHV